jgi:flagellar hook protein FlgE
MSLVSSLYTGQSGLEAATTDLSVIGDNIANSNTTGFKASRADFSNAMAQEMPSAGGTTSQIGLGAELMNVQKILTQGALSNTGVSTDLALDGGGFFVVKGSNNGQTGQFYTRAGQFTVDKTGYLVNQDGLRVQGYSAGQTGAIGPTPGDLQLGASVSPSLATSKINVKANLDQASALIAAPWDPLNPGTTSNFATTVTVYDSIGAQHQVDIYFRKTADGNSAAVPPTGGTWEYHALTDGAGIEGGTAGTPVEISTATAINFNLDGSLQSAGTLGAATFVPKGHLTPQALAINLGTANAIPTAGLGMDGVTQTALQSQPTSVTQDGHGSGVLSSTSFDKTGKITGSFSNGQSRVIGQVAVATIDAPDQMQRVTGNLFADTSASGNSTIGLAGSGGRGAIVAGSLENSNVDLSTEFIKMIAAQRNYQANAKTVTTADSLLAELMNLKR